MIEDLLEALVAEFGGEVVFHAVPPSVFSAPSVVVVPRDPFITPGTHGAVTESWDVLAVVSLKAADRGLSQMRDLSLRVRKAASSVGGLWKRAGGPRLGSATDLSFVVVPNQIDFRYMPPDV